MNLQDGVQNCSQNIFNHKSKKRFSTPEKDDYSMNSDRKKLRPHNTDEGLICKLPSDCIFNIFRFLPSSRDRFSCAAVSKEWLILQASMQSSLFNSTPEFVDNNTHGFNNNQISKCIEGKHANDTRLAAITVGVSSEGKLSELSIRGGIRSQGITDFGLSIIARACENLKSLSLWDCYRITSKGIQWIAKGCPRLEKLDLVNLPLVDNAGLVTIAEHCSNLSILNLESLPLLDNSSISAVAKHSSQLASLNLVKCPLVSDEGITEIISNSPQLAKVKISSMNLEDGVLVAIGHHGKPFNSLSLEHISGLTGQGFSSLDLHQNLRFLSLKSCTGLEETSFKAIGESFTGLNRVTIQNCDALTDIGLQALTKSVSSLESLKLVECHNVTSVGLHELILNCHRSLKTLSLVKCRSLGLRINCIIRHRNTRFPCLHSLTIQKCHGIEEIFLSWVGNACGQVKHLSLTGQTSLTDRHFDTLLKALNNTDSNTLTSVDLSGCSQITDASVITLTNLFGKKLQRLLLGGCRNISDISLKMVSELCPCLVELELCKCGISDNGVFCLTTSSSQRLEVLSLSGCEMITDRSLRYLEMVSGRLEGLNLKGCPGLSKEGISSLKTSLWWCDFLH